MTDREALELLNMFTKAAQLAKLHNKHKVRLEMNEYELAEIMKKAFPKLSDEEALDLARRDLGIKTQN